MKLTTNVNGIYLGDPLLDNFMVELNKNHALVIIHPQRAINYPKNPITGTVAAIFKYKNLLRKIYGENGKNCLVNRE